MCCMHPSSIAADISMIKLIANITVEKLRNKSKTTVAEATKATPTLVVNGSTKPVGKATPTDQPLSKPTRPIDLGELRSRLQKAYDHPIPKIAVSDVMCHVMSCHVSGVSLAGTREWFQAVP